jgi:hypothetical protein
VSQLHTRRAQSKPLSYRFHGNCPPKTVKTHWTLDPIRDLALAQKWRRQMHSRFPVDFMNGRLNSYTAQVASHGNLLLCDRCTVSGIIALLTSRRSAKDSNAVDSETPYFLNGSSKCRPPLSFASIITRSSPSSKR